MCTQSTQKQNKAIHVHLLNKKQRRKEREKEKKMEGDVENRRKVLVKRTGYQQSGAKACHSWSLCLLLGDWGGMCWSFMPQNRRCSFAPSSLCNTIVSARTLFKRSLCPFRLLEVPFQDIYQDPQCSQARAVPPTAVWDKAEVTLSWLSFEPIHCRCLSFRTRLLAWWLFGK